MLRVSPGGQFSVLYNLDATPAEGISYRLALLDTEQFPGIQSANTEGGKPFYTNSSQLPVHYSDDLFEVLDLQDELQTHCTGGTVVHLVGYLRPVNQWNECKVEEFKQRKTYKIAQDIRQVAHQTTRYAW